MVSSVCALQAATGVGAAALAHVLVDARLATELQAVGLGLVAVELELRLHDLALGTLLHMHTCHLLIKTMLLRRFMGPP